MTNSWMDYDQMRRKHTANTSMMTNVDTLDGGQNTPLMVLRPKRYKRY